MRKPRLTKVQPDWSKYQVIVLNYDAPDERWPARLKASFAEYVRNGGGLVACHAADNTFPHWKPCNRGGRLAMLWSGPANRSSSHDEPILIAVTYGKGSNLSYHPGTRSAPLNAWAVGLYELWLATLGAANKGIGYQPQASFRSSDTM